MRDITPESFECGRGQCPRVYQLEDGRYAVKGELIGVDGVEATVVIDPRMIVAAVKEQLWSSQA